MMIDIGNKMIDIYSGNYKEMQEFVEYLKNDNTTKEVYELIYADIYKHNVFSSQIFKKVLSENGINIRVAL